MVYCPNCMVHLVFKDIKGLYQSVYCGASLIGSIMGPSSEYSYGIIYLKHTYHLCKYASTHVHMCLRMCMYRYECKYMSMHACMDGWMYVCMHACMLILIYIYNMYMCIYDVLWSSPDALRLQPDTAIELTSFRG